LALPEPDTDAKGRWDFIEHPNTPEWKLAQAYQEGKVLLT
jgi:hypothetical protein